MLNYPQIPGFNPEINITGFNGMPHPASQQCNGDIYAIPDKSPALQRTAVCILWSIFCCCLFQTITYARAMVVNIIHFIFTQFIIHFLP